MRCMACSRVVYGMCGLDFILQYLDILMFRIINIDLLNRRNVIYACMYEQFSIVKATYIKHAMHMYVGRKMRNHRRI